MKDHCEGCFSRGDEDACSEIDCGILNTWFIGALIDRQGITVENLKDRAKKAEAEVERLKSLLYDCMRDIFSTARTNQANINGIELNCPEDQPTLSRIGRHFVNQRGVDESLALIDRCRSVMGSMNCTQQQNGARQIKVCHWNEDMDGIWTRACSDAPWQFIDAGSTPHENGMRYCLECGSVIIEHEYDCAELDE